MKLMAIASEYGRFYFNPYLSNDEELAHGVYRFLVEYGQHVDMDDVEVDEIVSEEE